MASKKVSIYSSQKTLKKELKTATGGRKKTLETLTSKEAKDIPKRSRELDIGPGGIAKGGVILAKGAKKVIYKTNEPRADAVLSQEDGPKKKPKDPKKTPNVDSTGKSTKITVKRKG